MTNIIALIIVYLLSKYQKKISETEVETKTAYEVSVNRLEKADIE